MASLLRGVEQRVQVEELDQLRYVHSPQDHWERLLVSGTAPAPNTPPVPPLDVLEGDFEVGVCDFVMDSEPCVACLSLAMVDLGGTMVPWVGLLQPQRTHLAVELQLR